MSKHGHDWNYVVLQGETRVELYIDGPDPLENKAFFDALFARREAIEAKFGGPLKWQRLDEKRASRVSVTVDGGWADESTWPAAIEAAVGAMGRFYGVLGPVVAVELRSA